jgi:hypothetical protein
LLRIPAEPVLFSWGKIDWAVGLLHRYLYTNCGQIWFILTRR